MEHITYRGYDHTMKKKQRTARKVSTPAKNEAQQRPVQTYVSLNQWETLNRLALERTIEEGVKVSVSELVRRALTKAYFG